MDMSDNDIDKIDDYKKFVHTTNRCYTLLLILFGIATILFFDIGPKTIFNIEISRIAGLIGAILLGLTMFLSSKKIISLSTVYRGYHLGQARELLDNKLLSGIGTILVVLSLIYD